MLKVFLQMKQFEHLKLSPAACINIYKEIFSRDVFKEINLLLMFPLHALLHFEMWAIEEFFFSLRVENFQFKIRREKTRSQ